MLLDLQSSDSIGTNKFIVISMFVINALMDNKFY